MAVNLPADARARLNAHLDAVERELAASGSDRDHRRGIVDDLEAQIRDMLAARNAAPQLDDIEAVLAQLDPPKAYGADGDRKNETTRTVASPQTPQASIKTTEEKRLI